MLIDEGCTCSLYAATLTAVAMFTIYLTTVQVRNRRLNFRISSDPSWRTNVEAMLVVITESRETRTDYDTTPTLKVARKNRYHGTYLSALTFNCATSTFSVDHFSRAQFGLIRCAHASLIQEVARLYCYNLLPPLHSGVSGSIGRN